MPEKAFMDFNQLWYNLLSDYSRRGITRGTDKLIALGGVAQEVQEKTGLTYCAGHWLEMIATGLCWTYSDEPTTRASPYRAPTWSWAAVDGGIAYVTEQGPLNGMPHPDVDLINCSVDVGADGQIISGRLVLSAQVKEARLVPFSTSSSARICHVRHISSRDKVDSRDIGTVWLDDIGWWESLDVDKESIDQPALSRVFDLVRLNTRQWHNEDPYRERTTYEIMVLEKFGDTGQFARIGAGILEDEPFFEALPFESISIV